MVLATNRSCQVCELKHPRGFFFLFFLLLCTRDEEHAAILDGGWNKRSPTVDHVKLSVLREAKGVHALLWRRCIGPAIRTQPRILVVEQTITNKHTHKEEIVAVLGEEEGRKKEGREEGKERKGK